MSNLNLSKSEIAELGLRACGDKTQIARSAILIHPDRISIGSNVRIDAFCILSAGEEGIEIGDFIHIGAGVSVHGGGGRIVLNDFASLSGRVSIYTASDDFHDGWLVGPTVPDEYRKLKKGDVILAKFAVVGCGSVLLPGVSLGEGCAVGALSVIRKSVHPGQIVCGNPAVNVGSRDRAQLLALEQQLRAQVL